MQKPIVAFALIVSLILAGCASSGNKQLAKMDAQSVDLSILDGQTTKAEVLNLFGNPSHIDYDVNGNEKWFYKHVKARAKAINFIPVANAFVQGTNETHKQLVIMFDDEEVVKKHAFSMADGETRVGLLG